MFSIDNITKQSGHISNIFSSTELGMMKSMLLKAEMTKGYQTGSTHNNVQVSEHYGVDQKSIVYPWIKKLILSKTKKHFGSFDICFVSLNNSHEPFGIHFDHHIHEKLQLNGQYYFSFLIPLSVEDDQSKCDLASTIIFDSYDFKDRQQNAVQYHKDLLSHCKLHDLQKVNIQKIYNWSYGKLIWWDSKLLHASGSFNNFNNKQCLVGHTYVQ